MPPDNNEAKTAILLAAGRGSRLGSLSQTTPKTLLPLAGVPLFAWHYRACQQAGIQHLVVVTGYAASAWLAWLNPEQVISLIQTYFPTLPLAPLSLEFRHNSAWNNSNILGSLFVAEDYLQQQDCLVLYGDCPHQSSHLRSIAAFDSHFAIASDREWLALWTERMTNPLNDVESFRLNQKRQLIEIGKKPINVKAIQGQFCGLLKTTPYGWQNAQSLLNLSKTVLSQWDCTFWLQQLIERGFLIDIQEFAGGWVEIDSEQDKHCYEQIVTEQSSWSHDWR